MSPFYPVLGLLESVPTKRIHHPTRLVRIELGPLDELVSSIREKGLLQPIVVRPVEDGFEIVAGNRRFEACLRLGCRRIPCHVVELSDREAYELSLIENVQHKTLEPLEEGGAFKRYVDEYGYGGVSDLANRIGKSHSYVSRRVALVGLPEEIRNELVRRRTSSSLIQELLSLDSDDAKFMLNVIQEEGISSKDARRIVRQFRTGRSDAPRAFAIRPPDPPLATKKVERIDRVLNRCIVSLRVTMFRMDDATHEIDDEWLVGEVLRQYRTNVHDLISSLLQFRDRLRKMNSKGQGEKFLSEIAVPTIDSDRES